MKTVSLPANKTYKIRKAVFELIRSDPLVGILTVAEMRGQASTKIHNRRYAVAELHDDAVRMERGERQFRLTKPKADENSIPYFTCLNPRGHHECTCIGYEDEGICTHIQTLQALNEQGSLPEKKKATAGK